MQRREFIGLMGKAALSFPRPGYAQTKTDLPVVGLLLPPRLDTTAAKERISDLRKGLQEGGYIEKQVCNRPVSLIQSKADGSVRGCLQEM
jgi:hypothetical protein